MALHFYFDQDIIYIHFILMKFCCLFSLIFLCNFMWKFLEAIILSFIHISFATFWYWVFYESASNEHCHILIRFNYLLLLLYYCDVWVYILNHKELELSMALCMCIGKKTHTIISNINWNKEGMKKANKIVKFSIAYVVCDITRRASPFMLWCYTVANIQRG